MSDAKKCTRCGGTRLEPGGLGSFSLTFRPKNTPFLTMSGNDVAVNANMCLDCGTIEFVGDLEKARRLMGERAKPHSLLVTRSVHATGWRGVPLEPADSCNPRSSC